MSTHALNPDDQAFLAALEAQLQASSSDLRAHERHERHERQFAILMTPADTSRAHEEPSKGRTLDISLGGLRATIDQPPRIGDYYRLHIMSESRVPVAVFARCLRCSLLSETSFEIVMRFFQPLDEDQLPPS